jgi:hypothetical protein
MSYQVPNLLETIIIPNLGVNPAKDRVTGRHIN